MIPTTITSTSILEMAKQGWNAIIELYKQSTPGQREKILKILGGLAGFGALLKYLATLKSTILNETVLDDKKECGELADYDFWPHWDPKETKNSHYVEPDVFLEFDNFSIIIETKLTDETKIREGQNKNELEAYYNEYSKSKKSYLIALGGDTADIKKELEKFPELKEHLLTCSWWQLLWTIEAELNNLDKKNNDNETFRLLTDCVKAIKSYGYNSWSNDLTMLFDGNKKDYIIDDTEKTINYLKNINKEWERNEFYKMYKKLTA